MNNIAGLNPFSVTKLMDMLVDAVCVVDTNGRFAFVSAAAEKVFGYAPHEMVGQAMIDFVHPLDRERTLHAVAEVLAHTNRPNFENRYVRKDGSTVHVMWTARWSDEHQVRVAVARDVTEKRRADTLQKALYAISEAASAAEDLPTLYKRIHEVVGGLLLASGFSVSLYDDKSRVLSPVYHVDEMNVPPATGGLDDKSLAAEVVREGSAKLLSRDISPSDAPQYKDVGAAADWLGVPLVSKRGVRGALVVRSHVPRVTYSDDDIDLLTFISAQVATAIDRKRADLELQHLARHDPLTGLVNRAVAEDRIFTSLARARREQSRVSVLYLDLDTFKDVNDTFGHGVGDDLLRDVARRLSACVRESDTAARMGGDEFLVLLSDVHTLEDATLVAEKIRVALCSPFYLAERNLCISPSIGVSSYPDHGSDAEQLVRRADDAMYVAKREGGNRMRMARSYAVALVPTDGAAA